MRQLDGGPAHAPLILIHPADVSMRHPEDLTSIADKLREANAMGMSVLDYFAAKAMEADLIYQGLEGREELDHIAEMAYEMGRAMVAVREKERRRNREWELLRELYDVCKRADGFDGNEACDMMTRLEAFYAEEKKKK